MKQRAKKIKAEGFSLIEMMCVVLLLALVASIAVQHFIGIRAATEKVAAETGLKAIRDALTESYLTDMSSIPGFSLANIRLGNLLSATNVLGLDNMRINSVVWDEARQRGWRGPYLDGACSPFPLSTKAGDGFYPSHVVMSWLDVPDEFKHDGAASVYGFPGELTLNDPWGNPYVIQVPPSQAFTNPASVTDEQRFKYARVVSAGPDGKLSTKCFAVNFTNDVMATLWTDETRRDSRLAGLAADGTAMARGDDLVLFIRRMDIYEEDEP